MKRYAYVGPRELLKLPLSPSRRRVASADDVRDWARETRQVLEAGEVAATFVVDASGVLWIADRRSEHVACAGGAEVLAAGEVFFDLCGPCVEVVEATNQSTGYCPEPSSWPSLAQALDAAGVAHPGRWARAFEFRRCDACGALCLVKDEDWACVTCGSELSRTWNLRGE